MSITHEDTQLDALRAEADRERAGYRSAEASITADPNLSDEGKRTEIGQWREATKSKLTELRDRELKIVEQAITAREKTIDSKMGSTASDVIAFRDAQDRAERIETPAEARRIIERAIRTNDSSLAGAVFRRSLESNWREAMAVMTAAKPELSEAVEDLSLFVRFRDNTMARAMAYMF